MSEQWKLQQVKDLDLVVDYLSAHVKAGDIILLQGEVGAGKTTLIHRYVCSVGGKNPSSPTFSIHNEYQTNVAKIHHLDLYRLETEEEMMSAGIEEFLQDKDSIVFIEWSERLARSQLPLARRYFELTFKIEGDTRKLLWKEL